MCLVQPHPIFYVADDGVVHYAAATKQTLLLPSSAQDLFDVLMKAYPDGIDINEYAPSQDCEAAEDSVKNTVMTLEQAGTLKRCQ